MFGFGGRGGGICVCVGRAGLPETWLMFQLGFDDSSSDDEDVSYDICIESYKVEVRFCRIFSRSVSVMCGVKA